MLADAVPNHVQCAHGLVCGCNNSMHQVGEVSDDTEHVQQCVLPAYGYVQESFSVQPMDAAH